MTPLVINVDGTCGPELWALIEKCGDHLYPETVSDKYKSDRAKFHAKYLRLIQSAVMRECAPILRHAENLFRMESRRELVESEYHDSVSVVKGDDIGVGAYGGVTLREAEEQVAGDTFTIESRELLASRSVEVC